METVATLNRISRERLATLLLSKPKPRIAIIDVRDHDHIGGHIKGSRHVPSPTLDYTAPELVRQLKGEDVVVFHCMLSQQRGPSAALKYLRERRRLLGDDDRGAEGKPAAAREGIIVGEEGDEFKKVEGSEEKGEATDKAKSKGQEVYVLDGGFQMWQEKYGEDEALTEAYQKDIWEFGY